MLKFHPEFHWFCYPARLQDIERNGCHDLHKMRDGAAFANLMALLMSLGLSYAEPIFNVPPEFFEEPTTPMKPGGLLVMSTRPPLDDENERKGIPATKTELERRVFASLRQGLQQSWRGGIRLSDAMCELMEEARWTRFYPNLKTQPLTTRPKRRVSRFNLYGPGTFIASERGEWASTMGFMVVVPKQEGPNGLEQRVLAAWGMSGYSTLFWTWLLRHRLQDQVAEIVNSTTPRVLIGEFQIPARMADYPRKCVDAVVL
jgi:hypothetical protein